MSQFKFEHTCNITGDRVIHEFEAPTWMHAADQFVKFLRGAGYQLRDSSLAIDSDIHSLDYWNDEYGFCNINTYSAKANQGAE